MEHQYMYVGQVLLQQARLSTVGYVG